jgi:anti-anti-sigma factor
MPAPLGISQRFEDEVVVLTVHGHLVADEGDDALRAAVTGAIAAGSRYILLDLRDVTYMDSGGAGALAAMLLHVTRRAGRLKLLRPSLRVCRVLEITHLLSVFDIFEDEDAARRSFGLPETTKLLR